MAKKKFIMFDFDNTLVDSLKFWYKSIDQEAFKHFQSKRSKNFADARIGLTNHEIAKCFTEFAETKPKVNEVLKFWHERMIFYYTNKIKIIPGVKEFLGSLKQNGHTLVLASATPMKVLKVAIKHFGFEKYFDYVFTEESLKAPKREPLFYINLLKELNITSKDLFVFEDSFVSLTSANTLKIKTCAISHKINRKKLCMLGKCNKLIIKNYKSKKLKQLTFWKYVNKTWYVIYTYI